MCPAEIVPESAGFLQGRQSMAANFPHLRSVRWRIDLGVLPSSSIDELRRVTADSRRRYAGLRKHLLIDPHVRKFGNDCQDLAVDNPLSQNPDSMWGRFFLNAELEQTVDKDLSRLYPEHENYFQTSGCQGMLRRILLLWCLRHPECGYRQGMHELLAPLLYVLHADIQHLNEIRKLYEDHFVDKFDEFHENHDFNFKISSNSSEDDDRFEEQPKKHTNLSDLDANVQSAILLSDPYGAEGELGIVLSERFMEHDAYCMFDALMSGAGGSVSMAVFFTHHSPTSAPTQTGVAPVIEASLALYHLLSMVDSSLYSHLVELGVEPQYFALRWLRVLFGREFSLEYLLVIWDEIFSFDNTKSGNDDPGILNSPRGAFISAMAVSMMLHVRSSLLATEYVTTCLQRLLNFPEEVDVPKLIGKAKSLVSLAMEANVSSHATPLIEHESYNNKRTSTKGGHSHSLSFDSSSPRTPLGVVGVPERYWEEKWRVMQEEEETKKKSSPNLPPSKKKGWTDRIKKRLSRTESDPCPSKGEKRERNNKSSVRRSLLEDLARQLNADEEAEEVGGGGQQIESSSQKDPLCVESDLTVKDVVVERVSYIDKICAPSNASDDLVQQLSIDEDTEQIVHGNESDVVVKNVVVDRASYIDKICSARSEDHSLSPAFSEPASPTENDTEKSSTESSMAHDMMDGEHQNSYSFKSAIEEEEGEEEPALPISDGPEMNDSGDVSSDANGAEGSSGPENGPKEPMRTISRELKALSGKFQWLFKFGRHNNNAGEGSSEKRVQAEDAKSADGGSLQGSKARLLSADDADRGPLNVKVDVSDQNLSSTLRNLGQSMMENIQILETAFQQEKTQAGTIEPLSKHALVEKGQVTAIAALTELRKISNLLKEM